MSRVKRVDGCGWMFVECGIIVDTGSRINYVWQMTAILHTPARYIGAVVVVVAAARRKWQ